MKINMELKYSINIYSTSIVNIHKPDEHRFLVHCVVLHICIITNENILTQNTTLFAIRSR